ncbi:MAG: hypothetical protein EPO68_08905 [Planctomycetota bacterium]|nr:MAG: hypothetical protein EPO68_08905 [Planctomycetota bacterium]
MSARQRASSPSVTTVARALAFVRKHGIVLEAARGPVPSLADAIAGEPVGGSWWSHARSQQIFKLTRAVRDSDDVLVCRLLDGKITFVHRRLWPALVRCAAQFPRKNLARVQETHRSTGRHVTRTLGFPKWVPDADIGKAAQLSDSAARTALHRCMRLS